MLVGWRNEGSPSQTNTGHTSKQRGHTTRNFPKIWSSHKKKETVSMPCFSAWQQFPLSLSLSLSFSGLVIVCISTCPTNTRRVRPKTWWHQIGRILAKHLATRLRWSWNFCALRVGRVLERVARKDGWQLCHLGSGGNEKRSDMRRQSEPAKDVGKNKVIKGRLFVDSLTNWRFVAAKEAPNASSPPSCWRCEAAEQSCHCGFL